MLNKQMHGRQSLRLVIIGPTGKARSLKDYRGSRMTTWTIRGVTDCHCHCLAHSRILLPAEPKGSGRLCSPDSTAAMISRNDYAKSIHE